MILALLGCKPEQVEPKLLVEATVETSPAIATVGTLTWTTDTPVRGRVRYASSARELVTSLESEAATSHTTLLVGMPGETEVSWTIEDEAGEWLATGTWTTGDVPVAYPEPETDGGSADRYMVTTLLGSSHAVVILDPDGRIVWYHDNDSGLDAYRAALAGDGSGVRYMVGDVSGDPSDASELRKVSWDGTEVTAVAVPYLAQDFVELDDGTVAAITAEVRTGDDDETIKGSGIVEVGSDGAWEAVWSSWDCFDPAVNASNDPALGWTWVNALDYDAATDHYVVSVRNFSSLVWIDRATGTCDRIIGGELSDYDFDGDRWLHSHQFQFWDDHLLVFDNDGAGGNRSRALEYVLDDDAGTATQVWDHTPDPSVFSFVLGDVARLEDDSTFVAFSVAGQLDRVGADGSLLFRANTPVGHVFGYVSLVPDVAR